MPNAASRTRRPVWPGVPLGAAAGTLATAAAVLTSPDLYIDWGSLAGMLVVIPACALGAAAVVAIPLAVRRRIAWTAVPLALVTSVVLGELIFQATLGTAFARRSAARHWTAVERRASAERKAEERAVCRRVMAERPTPPPPAPPGAVLSRSAPPEGAGSGAALLAYDRARCAALLKR
ncbi:MAG: hypothetical protein M3Q37_12675 [Gemmatimonadota bacterium]|nr:hypothetical protein [Gemmatimonadota bacterium]